MGVMKYIGNKLLSITLFIVALSIGITYGSGNVIVGWIAIIIAISGIYFWKHSPF